MTDLKKRAFDKIKELFGIDYRSLAFFRISIAVILLFDLIIRATSLKAFYSDYGTLPRSYIFERFGDSFLSLNYLSGSVSFQVFLFVIAFIFAIMLLFGYKTRFVTIASWILLISLQNRNPMVLQGGDVLFRMLLFWAMFLPLGRVYSFDAFLGQKKGNEKYHLSIGTLALLMQPVFLYFFSALLKTGKEWLVEGSAIYYALSLDQFTTPIGRILYQHYEIMKGLTFFVWWLELIGILLFFLPIFTQRVRIFMFFVFLFFQAGMGLSMNLGPFPWIATASIIPFLPALFWDKIGSWLKKREKIRIYFDGECRFCRKMLFIVVGFFMVDCIIEPAQKHSKFNKEMLKNNSWIVLDSKGNHHYRFEAFRVVFSSSPIFFVFAWILNIPFVVPIGNFFYRIVANNRSFFGFFLRREYDVNPKISLYLKIIGNIIALLLLIFVFLWNVQTLGYNSVPDNTEWIANKLRIDQKWNMFAPFPLKEDGWYVIPATLRNGTEIDVYNQGNFGEGKEVDYSKPANVAGIYDDERWRKYMMNLWDGGNTGYRPYFAKWLCSEWNSKHSENQSMDSLKIVFVKEVSLPNYQYSKPENVTIYQMKCPS